MIFNEYTLDELCNIGSSKRIYLSEYVSEGIPFYRGKEIIEKSNGKNISSELFISEERYEEIKNKYKVPKIGDILISAVGTLGKCWYVDEEKFYFKDGNLVWLNDFNTDIINPKFLYYKLTSKWFESIIDGICIGSTQKALTIEQLKKIIIKIPAMTIQNKVVNIMDSINNKLKVNNVINNNLRELIKSMYDELINNVDWNEVELSQVANVSSGKRPTKKNETDEYPIIGANGIMAYTNEFNMNSDLIITGRVGTLGVVKRYYKPIWASDNTLIVNTKYLNYIESYLKTIDYNSLNRGSTQPLLTQGDLNKQTLLFSENEVLEFENKVTPIVNKIRFNEEQNEILIQLRDTLLPKLMNGEIDLDNVEI